MSFDSDPKDASKRILGYHPESDSLFVCKSETEFISYGPEIDDVTGVDWAEKRWLEENVIES